MTAPSPWLTAHHAHIMTELRARLAPTLGDPLGEDVTLASARPDHSPSLALLWREVSITIADDGGRLTVTVVADDAEPVLIEPIVRPHEDEVIALVVRMVREALAGEGAAPDPPA